MLDEKKQIVDDYEIPIGPKIPTDQIFGDFQELEAQKAVVSATSERIKKIWGKLWEDEKLLEKLPISYKNDGKQTTQIVDCQPVVIPLLEGEIRVSRSQHLIPGENKEDGLNYLVLGISYHNSHGEFVTLPDFELRQNVDIIHGLKPNSQSEILLQMTKNHKYRQEARRFLALFKPEKDIGKIENPTPLQQQIIKQLGVK